MAYCVEIRPAGVEDVGLLLSLVGELAEFSQLAHTMRATEDDLRRSMFGTRPVAEALIADVDGVAVGFAVYFHTFSTFLGKPGLYLEDLFVRPTHRRGGVGKALLSRVGAIAQERDCGRLEWVAHNSNTPAVDFYKSLGAETLDGSSTFRMTGDALLRLATSSTL